MKILKYALFQKENYSIHFSAFEVLGKDSYMPCEALAHNHKFGSGLWRGLGCMLQGKGQLYDFVKEHIDETYAV